MMYTGGTSGKPKGVRRARPETLGAALEAQRRAGSMIGLDGSGPHLVTGPLYHAAPLLFAVYDMLNGAPMIVMPRWDEAEALRLLRERDVHHTHLVPTMFVRLLRLADAERAAFRAPSLHLVLHGAAPIAARGEAAHDRVVGARAGRVLGRDRERRRHARRFAGVARAPRHRGAGAAALGGLRRRRRRSSASARRDRRALLAAPRCAASPSSTTATPRRPRARISKPGVITLGDVGWVDADGYVYLCDRKSNMIISGGVNIYPAEIEQVLAEHPAVADVAVFGIPDDEWGETVKAAVQLAPGFAASPELEAEILAFGRVHLAGYKVPRSIDFEARAAAPPDRKAARARACASATGPVANGASERSPGTGDVRASM